MLRVDNLKTYARERDFLLDVGEHILQEMRGDRVIERCVHIERNTLYVCSQSIPLNFRRIYVVGFGKASYHMAQGLYRILGERIYRGMINALYGRSFGKIRVNIVSHPFPDTHTVNASQKILEMVSEAGENDLIICLVSGGASAMFEVPEDGVSIEDIKEKTKNLMKRGANILEINRLRIRLSKVKGGKFLKYIAPAACIGLILSDIPEHPDFVGSGPTYSTGFHGNVKNFVVGDNTQALQIGKNYVESKGIPAKIYPGYLKGEPADIAEKIVELLDRHAILLGGETEVKLDSGHGIGGRNQELALYIAKYLKEGAFLCLGTDGIDGPTDAAGALVDATTIERAKKLGIDVNMELRRHNSYTILKKLGDLVFTGHTGTNIADICIGIGSLKDP